MSMFPLPFGVTVGIQAYQPGTVVDGYQSGETWAPAVQVPGCAVSPGNSVEAFEPNRDGVSVEFTVYAPPGTVVGAHDRAILPGHADPFDVVGMGKEWVNHFTDTSFGVVFLVGSFRG